MNGTDSHLEAELGGVRVGKWRRAVILAIAVSTLAFSAGFLAQPASAAPGALAGTWTSVDVDGSNQTLQLKGSGNPFYSAFLRDDFTSGVCGGPPAKLVGPAIAFDSEVSITGTLICLPGGNPIPGVRVGFNLVYDPVTDTLTDDAGVDWQRAS